MRSKRTSRSPPSGRSKRKSAKALQLQPTAATPVLRPYKKVERALAGDLPLHTSKAISERMGRVRRCDTKPERVVRKAASAAGLRYTTDNGDLPGSPDLANRRRRIAIFVHGCYWHRHHDCSKATSPKTNVAFWQNKFSRNVERDAVAIAELKRIGYGTLVIWECETRAPENIARKLSAQLAVAIA